MQSVENLNYFRMRATLSSWQEKPNLGVRNFSFFFVSLFFAWSACEGSMFWLQRSLCLLFLFAIDNSPSFSFSAFFIDWADSKEPVTRHASTMLACMDVTAPWLPAPRSPISHPFTGNRKASQQFFFLVLRRLVYEPYWCTSRKLSPRVFCLYASDHSGHSLRIW